MVLKIRQISKIFMKLLGTFFTVATIILSFTSWDEIGITSIWIKICMLLMIVVFAFVIALLIVQLQKTRVLWKQGNACIKLQYGDLQKISFPRRARWTSECTERIVVISVNTHYDTIVNNELVSAKSVHGQWINWMKNEGVTPEELNSRIKEAAQAQGIRPVRSDNAKSGNAEAYQRGTIIELTFNRTHFFLIALSEFDENLNAQTTRDELIDVIKNLIIHYDERGSGQPLYTPLMGTELSRANLTEQEALILLADMFQLYSDKIHGEATIVVYNKHKCEVSIFLR